MHYKFPKITHIDDVLPHVKDNPSFIIADKGSYIVINYYSLMGDPFGTMQFTSKMVPGGYGEPYFLEADIIRRECRGIIFDKATGRVIGRRFHKFFNVNEREETLMNRVDLSQPHVILEKLDGSMITPFVTSDGVLHWGTKMGETDVAKPIAAFVDDHLGYLNFVNVMHAYGYTPIFEWCSLDNRIVVAHPEPRLVLTAIRDNITGRYWDYNFMVETAFAYKVDVVQAIPGGHFGIEKVIDMARNLVGEEGFVLRFDDGHMVKIKSDWYVAIHKAKDEILYERNVARLIMDEKIDDVIPFLVEFDQKRIRQYMQDFQESFAALYDDLFKLTHKALWEQKLSRKDFAIEVAPRLGPFAQIIFREFEALQALAAVPDDHTTDVSVVSRLHSQFWSLVYSKTNSNSGWEAFKKSARIVVDFNSKGVEE